MKKRVGVLCCFIFVLGFTYWLVQQVRGDKYIQALNMGDVDRAFSNSWREYGFDMSEGDDVESVKASDYIRPLNFIDLEASCDGDPLVALMMNKFEVLIDGQVQDLAGLYVGSGGIQVYIFKLNKKNNKLIQLYSDVMLDLKGVANKSENCPPVQVHQRNSDMLADEDAPYSKDYLLIYSSVSKVYELKKE